MRELEFMRDYASAFKVDSGPLERLRYHVTGAIERGEKEPIVEKRPAAWTAYDYNSSR